MSDDLKKIAITLGSKGPHKTLPAGRRISLLHNGHYIICTTKAVYVWEHPYYPQLFLPFSELSSPTSAHPDLKFSPIGEAITDPKTGVDLAVPLSLAIGSTTISNILSFPTSNLPLPAAPLAGLVKIPFESIDKWFEEDAEIFIHPKDPFKRIDILPSSRHIRVMIDGKVVADSHFSQHLFETGLPTRYYLPFTALDSSVLRPSSTKTGCPYKGEAEYHHVEIEGKVFEDVVWYYTRPTLESIKIEGLYCFYNEKVTIELDGNILDSPETPFSNRKPNDKPSLE